MWGVCAYVGYSLGFGISVIAALGGYMENNNNSVELYTGREALPVDIGKKRYDLMGIVIFSIACGVLLVRIFINLIASYVTSDMALDAIFTLMVQVGVLFVMPALIYYFAFKMKPKEILHFSNYRKTQWYNLALAVPIGITAMFVTTGVSLLWQNVIALFGYTHSSSATEFPDTFNFGLFLVSVLLTGILPAVCEEFAIRGGLLTTMRKSFSQRKTILLMGVVFGLFHQNITQVFYTALFGALMAAIVLKTKSIFPAMIIHFLNNSTSVYIEYAENYGWWGGGYYDFIKVNLQTRPLAVLGLYMVVCAVFAGLLVLLFYLNSHSRLKKKKDVITSSGFDVTNGKVVLVGEENPEMVRELDMEKEVYGAKQQELLFRPTLKDNVFYIGAIVVTVLSTIFSFIWGWVI